MFKVYMTQNNVLHEEASVSAGSWINMIRPSRDESEMVAKLVGVEIDPDDIMAALDEEESARIELEEGYTLILVDSDDGDAP